MSTMKQLIKASPVMLEPVIDAKRTLVVLRSEGTWPFGEGTGELTQFRWLD